MMAKFEQEFVSEVINFVRRFDAGEFSHETRMELIPFITAVRGKAMVLSNSLESEQQQINSLKNENMRLRKIAAHVPPRIYIEAKESAGFGTAIVTDFVVQCDTVDQTEARFVRVVNGIKALRRYVLVEGYAKSVDDSPSIGFAYDSSIWGFAANPEYEAGEALEKCEKWLHGELDKLAALADPMPISLQNNRRGAV